MGLSRTFVGFSSTDQHRHELMGAWKNNTSIDFNFADFQLNMPLDSENEDKSCGCAVSGSTWLHLCALDRQICPIQTDMRAGKFRLRWRKRASYIAINQDRSRYLNPDLCPPIM